MEWAVSLPIWKGETAFIVGGGPSINEIDLGRLKGKKVIAVNNAAFRMPFAQFLYFMDCRWYRWNKERVRSFKGMRVTVCEQCKQDPYIRTLQRAPKVGFDPRPAWLSSGACSGHGGLSLGVKLGSSRLILLGFDMRQVNGASNFHQEHKEAPLPEVYLKHFIDPFVEFAAILTKRGVEVVNATPGSALPCFPIVHPDEVLP